MPRERPQPITRRITKLAAVYLLLGLAAIWAVAWGSAVMVRPKESPRIVVERVPPFRAVTVLDCFAGRAVDFAYGGDIQNVDWTIADFTERGTPTKVGRMPRIVADLPYDQTRSAPGWEARGEEFTGVEARGWPCLALRCDLYIDWTRAAGVANGELGARSLYEIRGGVAIESSRSAAHRERGALLLPYIPFWPGLLADTLFYALLFTGLHQLAAWGRRASRRGRGRCAACNYDLTGIDGVCPECGRPRP